MDLSRAVYSRDLKIVAMGVRDRLLNDDWSHAT